MLVPVNDAAQTLQQAMVSALSAIQGDLPPPIGGGTPTEATVAAVVDVIAALTAFSITLQSAMAAYPSTSISAKVFTE